MSSQDFGRVRGSDLTDLKKSACGQLTQWLEVTPLELKLTIEEEITHPDKKIDYDKENECCLCYCPLYDGLKEMTIKQAILEQQKIYQSKCNGKQHEQGIDVVRMSQCKGMHFFHKECLENQLKSNELQQFIKCAVCEISYGIQTGEMPSGQMSWSSKPFDKMPLEGYTSRNCKSVIIIHYSIPSGKNKDGSHFSGTSRSCYLPENQDGIRILSMLAEAFRRRLTFKVGTSITTGQGNVVVWQGIHHKTSPSGGTSSFGYPDPTYFDRVTQELEQRGVTANQIKKMENPSYGQIKV